MMGRKVTTFETAEDVPTTPADVDRLLEADPSITHVGLIHCETSTGILNPLAEIAAVVERHGKSLVVDAMSSFGAIGIDARTVRFDALDRGVRQVHRGSAGHGFRARAQERARNVRRELHVAGARPVRPVGLHGKDDAMALHAADARRRRVQRGARPARRAKAGSPRGSRATRRIARRSFPAWRSSGSRCSSRPEIQAPIILTFHAPPDPAYNFKDFYACVRDKGFILYPGKLTKVETFRVGCIGAIGSDEMRHAVNAIRDTLREMGIRQVSPVAAVARAA